MTKLYRNGKMAFTLAAVMLFASAVIPRTVVYAQEEEEPVFEEVLESEPEEPEAAGIDGGVVIAPEEENTFDDAQMAYEFNVHVCDETGKQIEQLIKGSGVSYQEKAITVILGYTEREHERLDRMLDRAINVKRAGGSLKILYVLSIEDEENASFLAEQSAKYPEVEFVSYHELNNKTIHEIAEREGFLNNCGNFPWPMSLIIPNDENRYPSAIFTGFKEDYEALLASAAGLTPYVPLLSAMITPGNVKVGVGETYQLTLNAIPADATYKDIMKGVWSSSDESVATVSDSGLVTAKSEGTAKIKAAVKHGNALCNTYCYVTVKEKKETTETQTGQSSGGTETSEGSGTGTDAGSITGTDTGNQDVYAGYRYGIWMKDENGWWFRYAGGDYAKDGITIIDDLFYFFGSDGYMRTGWQQEDGEWYYFDEDGAMLILWVKYGDNWYYLDPDTGAMATGWVDDDGTWYFMDGSGAMQTGWVKSGNNWYYMNPSSGAMETGWVDDGGTWYYMNPSGVMKTGWVQSGSAWYYMNPSSGAMATGWVDDGGTWYYMNPSGAMVTGWVFSDGAWYYMDASGAMIANTSRSIDGITYNFNGSGACTNP